MSSGTSPSSSPNGHLRRADPPRAARVDAVLPSSRPNGGGIAPEAAKSAARPDFIIAGAMKCGTSTLHRILASHPRIFIPDREIGFFDRDDPIEHPDYFLSSDVESGLYCPETSFGWSEYQHLFDGDESFPAEGLLYGEDSTSYFSSRIAPRRIKKLLPNVRIIICLRDPVEQIYSHYWHLVRTGRCTRPFLPAIKAHGSLMERSDYRDSIRRYRSFFGEDRLLIVLLEDFLQDHPRNLERICSFLGVEAVSLGQPAVWENKGSYPKRTGLRLAINRLIDNERHPLYESLWARTAGDRMVALGQRALLRLAGRVAGTTDRKPPLPAAVREFVTRYWLERNSGLRDHVDADLERYWRVYRRG